MDGNALFKRILTMTLPPKQSAFLWGARKSGKSTYLRHAFPEAIYYDLLKSDLYQRLLKAPHLLREELLAKQQFAINTSKTPSHLVIVDEVQKLPLLLDEIHWLIENTDYQFILCGSSARKLRQQGVNLLGGRAWKYHFFPLVYPELPVFDLQTIYNKGLLPSHYLSPSIHRALQAYLEDYITLEIQAEGLVRNLPGFARFMDALRFSHGEMISYTNIARQASIDAKTVREYFHILVDTHLGYMLFPYRKRISRDIISDTPKFYLFDVGVANFIKKQSFDDINTKEAGQCLEHYVFLELMAYKHLREKDFEIAYWRTKSGLEVDFILGDGHTAIEVKNSTQVHPSEFKALKAFAEEHRPKQTIVVSRDPKPRIVSVGEAEIHILPIEYFLKSLWADTLF